MIISFLHAENLRKSAVKSKALLISLEPSCLYNGGHQQGKWEAINEGISVSTTHRKKLAWFKKQNVTMKTQKSMHLMNYGFRILHKLWIFAGPLTKRLYTFLFSHMDLYMYKYLFKNLYLHLQKIDNLKDLASKEVKKIYRSSFGSN